MNSRESINDLLSKKEEVTNVKVSFFQKLTFYIIICLKTIAKFLNYHYDESSLPNENESSKGMKEFEFFYNKCRKELFRIITVYPLLAFFITSNLNCFFKNQLHKDQPYITCLTLVYCFYLAKAIYISLEARITELNFDIKDNFKNFIHLLILITGLLNFGLLGIFTGKIFGLALAATFEKNLNISSYLASGIATLLHHFALGIFIFILHENISLLTSVYYNNQTNTFVNNVLMLTRPNLLLYFVITFFIYSYINLNILFYEPYRNIIIENFIKYDCLKFDIITFIVSFSVCYIFIKIFDWLRKWFISTKKEIGLLVEVSREEIKAFSTLPFIILFMFLLYIYFPVLKLMELLNFLGIGIVALFIWFFIVVFVQVILKKLCRLKMDFRNYLYYDNYAATH